MARKIGLVKADHLLDFSSFPFVLPMWRKAVAVGELLYLKLHPILSLLRAGTCKCALYKPTGYEAEVIRAGATAKAA